MKAFLKILSFLYLALLFYIFFLARRRAFPSLHGGRRYLNLVPFRNKFYHLEYSVSIFGREQLNFYADLFGNILLFIPFAFIFAIVFHVKSLGKIVGIAFITSVCVEVIQFVLRIGVADIDDVILNTLGACIGVLLIMLLRKSTNTLVQKTGLFVEK